MIGRAEWAELGAYITPPGGDRRDYDEPLLVRLVDVMCGPCQFEVVEQDGWTAKFFPLARGDFSHCPACARKVEERMEDSRAAGKGGLLTLSDAIPEITPEQAREMTALHESAHAVVGLTLGIGVDSVSMTPRSCVKGGVEVGAAAAVDYTDGALAAASPEAVGAATMAGVQAERYWLELHDLDTPSNLVRIAVHGGGDAADLQAGIISNDYPRFAAEARRDAMRLVKDQWSVISTVAAHLLKRGQVDGAWVHRQVREAARA